MDSLTKICYAFIGTVVKLKIFYTFFVPSIFKNIVVFMSFFLLKMFRGPFLLSPFSVNDSCYRSDGSS
jgi:hypothetical protein